MSEAIKDLSGQRENLAGGVAFLQDLWRAENLPFNVAVHGTADAAHPPRIKPSLARSDDQVVLVFRDEFIPFDPFIVPPPDLSSEIGEREVAGLGVFLVNEMMDEADYRREDGWNRLLLVKHVGGAS